MVQLIAETVFDVALKKNTYRIELIIENENVDGIVVPQVKVVWVETKKGISHIEKKYNYYRDDIHNTEDFIKLSATKSTMSGGYYTVKCQGKKRLKRRVAC